jgi:hypothetical protein
MTKISVSGTDAKNAPPQMKLASWTEDWTPHLDALTEWEPQPADSELNFFCMTTSTVDETKEVVDETLTKWVANSGKREYSVD